MRIFAIADLHLSRANPKPMGVFGAHWENYWDRVRTAWRRDIAQEDVVLVAGDISWAMKLQDAALDLAEISELPGKKILLRGNHDYWWSSVTKIRELLTNETYVLQNDALRLGNFVFCGCRGWVLPGSNGYSEENDSKIYARELLRLEMSLEYAKKLAGEDGRIIAMSHYPPFDGETADPGMTSLYAQYGVERVIYGHIHRKPPKEQQIRSFEGITYYLTSCDTLDFEPLQII